MFFLESEMFQLKFYSKSKHPFYVQYFFTRPSCRLCGNVEMYGTARGAIEYSIIRLMCFACWITNTVNTHSEYVIFIAFAWKQWFHECALMLRLYVYFLFCYKLYMYVKIQIVFHREFSL